MRQLAAAIDGASRAIEGAVSGMTNVLRSADWQDSQRVRFDEQFRELAKVSRAFSDGAATTVPFLKKKADEIDEFLR